MTQLYICSFSSSDLKKSINRYLFQAKQMSIYKDIKVYKEIDLPKKIREQIKDFNSKKKRLYGYGCWKAFIIKNYLKYLPRTWSLIERRLKNPVFKSLNLLFKKHLRIKKLKKINNL